MTMEENIKKILKLVNIIKKDQKRVYTTNLNRNPIDWSDVSYTVYEKKTWAIFALYDDEITEAIIDYVEKKLITIS